MQSPELRLQQVSLQPRISTAKRAAIAEANYLLQDLSFEVMAGDRVAIVGASGAGKTLLLRLLNRLSEPTTGTIFFAEQPYSQIPVLKLRQQIVLVPQESKLLGMTVQQALEYPLHLRQLDPATRQHQISETLEQLHIPADWRDRTEQQLSLGQRQLVAIARALVIRPRVLLLDEPTSALDVGRSQRLLDGLQQLGDRTTVLMVNHQLELAEQFCTRVLQLQQGQLVQDVTGDRMDWPGLRDRLIQQEAQADEWE